ncbi:MAG TPA: Co2+/Mg2+ efflux protein ApaG [Deltaproteobacteria bacterium]|nr:Co2+/Mg2+ efflux protein ApaG [Deltaproteobacteria bacterium]
MKETVNPTSTAKTRDILVEVESEYDLERSDPQNSYYFFVYHIKITNQGRQTAQLLSRHWIITDAEGNVEEVRGPGVVGEQPVLKPGESFSYTSACPLKTPTGKMQGVYQMVLENGEKFDAEIASFELAPGYTLH